MYRVAQFSNDINYGVLGVQVQNKTHAQEMYLLGLVITPKFLRNRAHNVDQSVTHAQWPI